MKPDWRWLSWGCWAGVMLAAGWVLAQGIQLRYELTLFLPQPRGAEQTLLFERLGEGPGSRLLTIALSGAPDDALLRVREAMAASLGHQPEIDRVLSGPEMVAELEPPQPLWRYRYLLTDTDLEVTALHQALMQRLTDLSILGGAQLRELIAADPVLSILQLVERIAPVQAASGAGDWRTADGAWLLVVETAAPAFDMAAQQAAVAAIWQAYDAADPPPQAGLELSGPGAFGVQLQDTIRAEASWRSLLAGAGVVLVLLLAYRRLRLVMLSALPLMSGALIGLAGVALIFDGVHGITLAFGFTLLGVAIDYPLHLFSHARSRGAVLAIRSIWPTLALGALSTVIAYLAMAVGGSVGLAQLGVFTALGVAAALLTTRMLLPSLIDQRDYGPSFGTMAAPHLRWWPLVLVLAAGGGLLALTADQGLWKDDLAALSPVSPARLARDASFREVLGAPEMRYAVAVDAATVEAVLQASEQVSTLLADSDAVEGQLPPVWLLPSGQTQRARQQALPDSLELRNRLSRAVADTPFGADRFEDFIAAVETSRGLPVLTMDDYRGTPLERLLDAHLYQAGDRWVALTSLYGIHDMDAVRQLLPAGARLVDFRHTSETLVADYRQRTILLLAGAAVLIGLLLWWRLRRGARVLWIMGSVLAAMLASLGLVAAVAGGLNLYHLIAVILVGGLGLDYALFASRSDTTAERADTWHALTACAASTAIAFGVLALSSIPVLQAIGMTVTTGCLIAYAASRLGCH